ncbi:hypothetical protein GCM10027610_003850 [Dactylosporangium cerinum]
MGRAARRDMSYRAVTMSGMDEIRSEGGGFRTSDVAVVAGLSPSVRKAITQMTPVWSDRSLAVLKALSDAQPAESSWHQVSVVTQLEALARVGSPAGSIADDLRAIWRAGQQHPQIAASGTVRSAACDAGTSKPRLTAWLLDQFASLAVERNVGPLAAPTLGPIAVVDATPRVRRLRFDAAHELRCDLLHRPGQDGSPSSR